jgi:hypothetical protein
MSGGSMDYICYKVADAATHVRDREISKLLLDLSELLHDLEWYESGDYGEGAYEESLTKFKAKWFKADRTERLKGYIDESLNEVRDELYQMIGENKDE